MLEVIYMVKGSSSGKFSVIEKCYDTVEKKDIWTVVDGMEGLNFTNASWICKRLQTQYEIQVEEAWDRELDYYIENYDK